MKIPDGATHFWPPTLEYYKLDNKNNWVVCTRVHPIWIKSRASYRWKKLVPLKKTKKILEIY